MSGELREEMRGYITDIPDDPHPAEHLEQIVSRIDFPPREALTATVLEEVVVVMPTLAEGKESQKPIVAATVKRVESPTSPKVGKAIDGEGTVPQQNGAQYESPN